MPPMPANKSMNLAIYGYELEFGHKYSENGGKACSLFRLLLGTYFFHAEMFSILHAQKLPFPLLES